MKRTVVFDAEFDSLQPERVWCIVAKDIGTNEVHVFRSDREDFVLRFTTFVDSVVCWIGHHVIQYDVPNLNKLLGTNINWRRCIDTLVVSRLIHYEKPGGHSVQNWAKQFGMTKKFIDVYDDPSRIDDYVERCKYDVEIQHQIYNSLKKYIKDPSFKKALRVEHDVQQICHDMHVNGFSFDKERAEELLAQIKGEMSELEGRMSDEIPPVLVRDAPYKLKVNKDGQPSKGTLKNAGTLCVTDGATLYRFHYEPFNPGSAKQRIEFLNKAGWQPTEKTKGHLKCERDLNSVKYKLNRAKDYQKERLQKEADKLQERLSHFKAYGWKVNETNLNTLPPESPSAARTLAQWLTLEGRRGDLEEWLSAYDTGSQRIHGFFNGIGAWSHRMSHVRPNQGNIFSNFTPDMCKADVPTAVEEVKIKYNGTLRSLWRAAPGKVLVGTDAEGIQMRVLAHYINDPTYTEAIVNGNKEDGTDVHSYNRQLLGQVCRSRDDAKTFIYAWLLGAGPAKIAEILGCSFVQAKAAMDLFVRSVPGLSELKRDRIPSDAKRGYFVGLDKRKVICRSERLVITGYLQNGEACVMKHANVLWRKWADEEGIPRDWWKQVDFVHDEWVTETEDDFKLACRIGELQSKAIVQTGIDLNLNCALAGEYKVGKDWLSVH